MEYTKNLVLITVLSFVIGGCGGGNTTISDNSNTTSTSSTTTGSGGTSSTGGSGGTVTTGNVTLKWTSPTTRTDNTAVSLSDISAFRLYYGTSATNTPNYITITNGTATQYTVTLPTGSYYFRISAIDSSGYEGLISNAVQKSI